MTPEEAGEVIATLQACFPQSKLPESTVISWIRLLSADGERFDPDDAFAAIDIARDVEPLDAIDAGDDRRYAHRQAGSVRVSAEAR